MAKTVNDILNLIKENDIKMIDFKMVDINGQYRHVTIPAENFSLVGCKKDSIRKGGRWFSLRATHPLFSL